MAKQAWRPMSEFDPSKPALVHDELNRTTFEWEPERWAESYRQTAEELPSRHGPRRQDRSTMSRRPLPAGGPCLPA